MWIRQNGDSYTTTRLQRHNGGTFKKKKKRRDSDWHLCLNFTATVF